VIPFRSLIVGVKPNALFGKFTWRIENFSEISKRELRSSQFDVGEYKWCVGFFLKVHSALAAQQLKVWLLSAGTFWCTPKVVTSATTCPCFFVWQTMTSCFQVRMVVPLVRVWQCGR